MRADRRRPSVRSRSWLVAATFACLTLAALLRAGASAAGSTAASPASSLDTGEARERVLVHLRVMGTEVMGIGRDADTLGSTGSHGSADASLGMNESAALYVSVMGRSRGIANPNRLCMKATGQAPNEKRQEFRDRYIVEGVHVWWAEVRVLPAKMGQVSLEVKWKHFSGERPGKPILVAGDTRRIVMNEGENHVLDYLAQELPEPTGCYQNVTIDLMAELEEDPALAGETIGYDLWFKHTDNAGNVTARRFQAVGRQGEKLAFRFAPLRFPVPGAVLDNGSILDSILESSGTIRGRLRSDGTIRLDADVTRWIGAAAPGDSRTGGYGAGGRKQVTVAGGETISMVLPSPAEGGRYGYYDRTGTARPGAAASGGTAAIPPRTITVDNREFYAGHKDELIVTARRVQ